MAIWEALVSEYMPEPNVNLWREVEAKFSDRWNFPNCIGSVDGKHVLLQKPIRSGTLYFNYKKTFSIVLMAVADAEYRFVAVDIGQFGRVNDSACFNESVFGQRLASGQLDLPPDKPLPGTSTPSPHVLVADEAFPLQRNMMRPFPGSRLTDERRKVFNYRLSRARRTVESAFGIMSSRFRVFRRPLCILMEHADKVVKACTILHNFLLNHRIYLEACDLEQVEMHRQSGSSSLQPLVRVGRGSAAEARDIREDFVNYFVGPEGSVPWQYDRI